MGEISNKNLRITNTLDVFILTLSLTEDAAFNTSSNLMLLFMYIGTIVWLKAMNL
jgi:hypothetical protein